MILQIQQYSYSASQKFYLLLTLLFCGGGILFLFDTPFSPLGTNTLCLFRNITGVPCPGCGMGRGINHLLHLEFVEAVYINPLSVFVLPAIILTVCWMASDFLLGRETLFKIYLRVDKYFAANKMAKALIAIIILFEWVWNILKQ